MIVDISHDRIEQIRKILLNKCFCGPDVVELILEMLEDLESTHFRLHYLKIVGHIAWRGSPLRIMRIVISPEKYTDPIVLRVPIVWRYLCEGTIKYKARKLNKIYRGAIWPCHIYMDSVELKYTQSEPTYEAGVKHNRNVINARGNEIEDQFSLCICTDAIPEFINWLRNLCKLYDIDDYYNCGNENDLLYTYHKILDYQFKPKYIS